MSDNTNILSWTEVCVDGLTYRHIPITQELYNDKEKFTLCSANGNIENKIVIYVEIPDKCSKIKQNILGYTEMNKYLDYLKLLVNHALKELEIQQELKE